jgi:hypothetical protein
VTYGLCMRIMAIIRSSVQVRWCVLFILLHVTNSMKCCIFWQTSQFISLLIFFPIHMVAPLEPWSPCHPLQSCNA